MVIQSIETDGTTIEGYYDGYIVAAAQELSASVRNDFDGIIYICGRERSGKSTFAAQLAKLLQPNWSMEKGMCWTSQQFKDMVLAANQYDCIVLDEAYLTFSNSRRTDRLNDEIIGMLTQVGKKNLFIIIVAPTFWNMSYYLVVHRANCLFRIYTDVKNGKVVRGFWAAYDYDKKQELYFKGKANRDFKLVNPNKTGRFAAWKPFNRDEYDKRKEAALQELNDKYNKDNKLVNGDKLRQEGALRFAVQAYDTKLINYGKIAAVCDLLGISEMTFHRFRSKIGPNTSNEDLTDSIITNTTNTGNILLNDDEKTIEREGLSDE